MIHLLIGHRGVGKSSLLQRLQVYAAELGREIVTLDLDREIEKADGRSISEIFEKDGEGAFRALELKHFDLILAAHASSSCDVYVAAGAGFPGPIPDGVQVIWIRRPTDASGRIFLGRERPRLNANVSHYREYFERFAARESRYRDWSHQELMLTEGFDFPNDEERRFFFGNIEGKDSPSGGILSLLPENFKNFRNFIEQRLAWGIARFEIRDDLLSGDQIQLALKTIPKDRVLYSFRKYPDPREVDFVRRMGYLWDWPLELGLPGENDPPIVSLHTRHPSESIEEVCERFEQSAPNAHLKLAVAVRDFQELWDGHVWAQRDPANRTFLPCSSDGRWSWYRSLMKSHSQLCFIREGEGTSSDQPMLMKWFRLPSRIQKFSAILGDPVVHSRTPAAQHAFFAEMGVPVFSIRITESEWDRKAMNVLTRLGLRFASVTSPLKRKAYFLCQLEGLMDLDIDSTNTLYFDEALGSWRGTNTDVMGLETLLAPYRRNSKIAVWGAGGTLDPLKMVVPQAWFFSARTATRRDSDESANRYSPEILIWGVGRSHEETILPPPREWKPQVLVDLNYSEDSLGREYALETGARYVSGMEMFVKQAAGQRKFWSERLGRG